MLIHTYAARRRALERRRRSVEDDPATATAPDLVDLLRRRGITGTDARWVVDRCAEDGVPPADAWSRLDRALPPGCVPGPGARPCPADLLAVAGGLTGALPLRSATPRAS